MKAFFDERNEVGEAMRSSSKQNKNKKLLDIPEGTSFVWRHSSPIFHYVVNFIGRGQSGKFKFKATEFTFLGFENIFRCYSHTKTKENFLAEWTLKQIFIYCKLKKRATSLLVVLLLVAEYWTTQELRSWKVQKQVKFAFLQFAYLCRRHWEIIKKFGKYWKLALKPCAGSMLFGKRSPHS